MCKHDEQDMTKQKQHSCVTSKRALTCITLWLMVLLLLIMLLFLYYTISAKKQLIYHLSCRLLI